MTTFIFRVRNVPAALYKALGGFATNGVNMTKLESYQLDGRFVATMFYADVEGHPDDPPVARALEELGFFSTELHILGAYKASPYRAEANKGGRNSVELKGSDPAGLTPGRSAVGNRQSSALPGATCYCLCLCPILIHLARFLHRGPQLETKARRGGQCSSTATWSWTRISKS